MQILIAPDKLKGSLTASRVAEAIHRGLAPHFPSAQFHLFPLADGGEGTAEIFRIQLRAVKKVQPTRDALGRPIEGAFAWFPEKQLAVIDMSEASGLWRLNTQTLAPEKSNTFGTGLLMQAATELGAKTLIIGLGGSATNDGGVGLAAALGWQFLDHSGTILPPEPRFFSQIRHIQKTKTGTEVGRVIGLCDVENPLLGENGCTRIFGPQKGIKPEAQETFEASLRNVAEIMEQQLGQNWAIHPGAGAAGGLGFGLMAFCQASLRPGFEVIAELLKLEDCMSQCDLVLTAEGKLDGQTAQGKGPAGLARMAKTLHKPVIAFTGTLEHEKNLQDLFDAIIPIPHAPITLDESMRQAETLLEMAADRAGRLLNIGKTL